MTDEHPTHARGADRQSRAAVEASTRGVVVAHPRTQHAQRSAAALHQAHLLEAFATTIAVRPDSAFFTHLPATTTTWLLQKLGKRVIGELPREKVHSFPTCELVALSLIRVPGLSRFAEPLRERAERGFQRGVLALLRQRRPAALLTYDDSGYELFRSSHALDYCRVLDQTTGHLTSAIEIYREEKKRYPHLAHLLPNEPAEKILRATEEAQLADWILCPSTYVQRTLRRLGIAEEKLRLLPYGVDTAKFTPRPPDTSRRSKFRFVFVGRLSPGKGVHYLLQAMTHLSSPQIELRLIGQPCGNWPQAEITDARVQVLGPVSQDQLARELSEADAFVFPSLHEGSALAVYEALATGLPVVVTEHSGAVIEDEREGFVVPIRNVEKLAAAMSLLHQESQLREQMASAARLTAQRYSWQRYGNDLVAHFQHMLLAHGRR